MQRLVLQFIYSFLLRSLLKYVIGLKFDRTKFLKKEGPFVIVANHNSHLDTISLLASLPAKMVHKVKPVAARDHFGKTRFQEKLSCYFINTLLIERKKTPENNPVDDMVDALDKGYSLIIYPEGTRGEPEQQQALQPGIAFVLSKRPEVKYVPAYMIGMGKALPKGDRLVLPFNSALIYGEPTKVNSTGLKDILKQIESDLFKLRAKLVAPRRKDGKI